MEADRNGNAYVEAWDGYTGTAQGVYPASGADPVSALIAVAEDAQDAVMPALCAAWPVCPVHRLGVHARDHDEAAVWWCAGDGGHAVAAIGEQLGTLQRYQSRSWVRSVSAGTGTGAFGSAG